MKKGLLFGLSMSLFHLISWGVEVTFQVEMSNETVSPLGVHLAGSFADGNGDGIIDNNLPNWNPGGIALNDNGNGVWSVTIELVAGLYEYKFVNGNDWSNPEFFSSEEVCAQWLNGNRYVLFNESEPTLTIPLVCWNGCVACGVGCIDPFNPPTIPICLVTVDEWSGKNHIIWEPIANNAVQRIVVFKESNVQDVFDVIGEVDFSAEGAFEDVNSNPQVQSNRYRIGMKDSCGFVYAPLDGIHKTIHLTTSSGLGGNVNLNWNAYEGVVFDSYNIYRGSSLGNMNLIATVASNVLSYTDINPSTEELNYMIEVVGVSCNPNRSVIFSRSNILDLTALGLREENSQQISIYPNPVSSSLMVELEANCMGSPMMILNSMGDVVGNVIVTSTRTSMDIEHLPNGLYYLKTESLVQPFQVVR
jgi:hypothetical protein